MELTHQKFIKELLIKHKTRPQKTMGQNFLINRGFLAKILETADIKPSDTVVEIGPGIGNLTQELAKRAQRVIAIEKDKVMVEILKETLKDYQNIEIIHADVLRYTLHVTRYKLVANLPYYIASPVIRMFLETEQPPTSMVLMVQKEMAQRICAKPPDMSLLAVSVQYYADPKIITYVKKESFWPKPKVDSSIIKITPRYSALNSAGFRDAFFSIVKAGFSQPRKQLANNLSKALKKDRKEIEQWLLRNNISPTQRAETLSIEDWQRLSDAYA